MKTLRLVLKLDALVTGANGAAYLALAGPLEDLLGLDASVLRPVGAFLLVFAAAVWFVGTRPAVSRAAVLAVATANAGWVIGSLVLATLSPDDLKGVGTVWIVLQALVVAGFAGLQARLSSAAAGATRPSSSAISS